MNVHWHIGDVEKSCWFNTMMHDPNTYGLVVENTSTLLAPWAVEGGDRVYAAICDEKYNLDKFMLEIVEYVEKLVKEKNVESFVIYTNFVRGRLIGLYNGLKEVDAYCRVTIMCCER